MTKVTGNIQKVSEKKLRFKNRLIALGKMDFSSTIAMSQKQGTLFN